MGDGVRLAGKCMVNQEAQLAAFPSSRWIGDIDEAGNAMGDVCVFPNPRFGNTADVESKKLVRPPPMASGEHIEQATQDHCSSRQ
jgi:hypothetical protein